MFLPAPSFLPALTVISTFSPCLIARHAPFFIIPTVFPPFLQLFNEEKIEKSQSRNFNLDKRGGITHVWYGFVDTLFLQISFKGNEFQ